MSDPEKPTATTPLAPVPSRTRSIPIEHIDSLHLPDEHSSAFLQPDYASERIIDEEGEDAGEGSDVTMAHRDEENQLPTALTRRTITRTTTMVVPAEEREWKDNIVLWDSKSDPENPKNWNTGYKYTVTVLLGMVTMCSGLSSSIFSSATSYIAADYGLNEETSILGTSLFIAGYIFGPVIWGPASEIYGRKIAVLIPVFLFICFSAGTAVSKDVQSIFITRFFGGFFASAPVTNVGGALADMFDQRSRATAVVFYSLAVVGGPTLGPLIGASVCESYLGWRWTMYLVVIFTSFILTLAVLFVPETFAPVLLTRKAARLRMKTGKWQLHSSHEMVERSVSNVLEKNIARPLQMLVREPMVFLICLYNSFTYGILYLLFAAVPEIFVKHHGWTEVESSLTFLATFVGCLISAGLNLGYATYVFAPHLDSHGGAARPEMRLPLMMLGGMLFPAGFFLLGFAPPAGKVVGLGFIGSSFLLIFQSGINYLIDAYTLHAASALASNTLLRSIFAAGLPFSVPQMFASLGVNYTCLTLGCLAAAMGCIPFLFFVFGPNLRARSKMAIDLHTPEQLTKR